MSLLTEKETKFLLNLIKSGKKTRIQCNEELFKKFGRNINERNLTKLAKRNGLGFKEIQSQGEMKYFSELIGRNYPIKFNVNICIK